VSDYELQFGEGKPITGNSITTPAEALSGACKSRHSKNPVYKSSGMSKSLWLPEYGYAIDPNKDLGAMWIQTSLPPV